MTALDIFPEPLWLVFAALFGALWGSFANVVIWRWPRGQSVAFPASHCPSCGTSIAPYDNVPVFAFLWLRGRCRSCAGAISWRYPLVEASMALLSAAAFQDSVLYAGTLEVVTLLHYLMSFVFFWALVVVAFIDLDTQLIPTSITAVVTALGLGANLALPGGEATDAAIGVALGFGIVWLLGNGYRLLRGEVGMGLGDAHLVGMVGAVVGWQGALFCLVAGSIQGALAQLILVVADRSWRHGPVSPWRRPVPFGPFLVAGALEYAVFGDRLTPLYRQLFTL